MTVNELREMIANIPGDAKVEINSVWDPEREEFMPDGCSGFYHAGDGKVYLTPDVVAI